MRQEQTAGVDSRRQAKRRRRYVIDPAFQRKYTIMIMIGVFVVSALMTTTLFGVLYDQARARTLHMAAENPWQNTLTIALSAAGFASVMAVAFGVWSIIVTHRICGPLYVVSGFLGELAQGRFPQKRPLRKNDEFKEFYEQFWRAVDALKAKQESELAVLTQALKLAKATPGGDAQDQEQALASIAARLEDLCRQVSETGQTGTTQPAVPVAQS